MLAFVSLGYSQTSYTDSIQNLRDERNLHMVDSTSILNDEEKENFIALDFFDIDSSWVITANFKKKKGKVFKMKTSTSRLPEYRQYGIISFYVNDTLVELPVYENMALKKNKEYKNYLFLPVKDYTIPNESYGAGRYIDLEKPDGKTIIIDFNMLYNPYCAYSSRYSCPIAPKENSINVRINAGEKIPRLKEEH